MLNGTMTQADWIRANYNLPNRPEDPCVLWPEGWAESAGYGRLSVGNKSYSAHGYALELRDKDAGMTKPEGAIACHGCRNRRCITHVRWGTYSKNNGEDRYADGTALIGESNPISKLTENQVMEIVRMGAAGVRHRDIATQFGVSKTPIALILSGGTWSHLTGIDPDEHRRLALPGAAKLNKDQVLEVVRLRGEGWTHRRIAEHFGLSRPPISAILQGRTWSAVTGRGCTS